MTSSPVLFLAAIAAVFGFSAPVAAQQSDCPFTDVFEKLVCEQEIEDRRLRLDQTKAKRREVAATAGEGPIDAGAFPALLRVYGRPGELTAQFDANGAPITVTAGQAVSGWRVTAITRNTVTLERGGDRRTVSMMSGAAPVTPAPQSVQSVPRATATASAPVDLPTLEPQPR